MMLRWIALATLLIAGCATPGRPACHTYHETTATFKVAIEIETPVDTLRPATAVRLGVELKR